MSENYKILGQSNTGIPIDGFYQAKDVYTVPENTQAVISNINILNTSSNIQEYSVGIANASDASSSRAVPTDINRFIILSNQNSVMDTYRYVPESTSQWEKYTDNNVSTVGMIQDRVLLTNTGRIIYISGFYYYMSDNLGATWNEYDFGQSISVPHIINGSSGYIHLLDSTNNRLGTSSNNGVSWSFSSLPSGSWTNIAFGNGILILVQNNSSSAALSYDYGSSWTTFTLPDTASGEIVYGNGKFVIAPKGVWRNRVIVSDDDGQTWSAVTISQYIYFQQLKFRDGLFLGCGSRSGGGNYTLVSTDGLDWTVRSVGSLTPTDIDHSGGVIIATPSTADYFYKSDDGGNSWTTEPSTDDWAAKAILAAPYVQNQNVLYQKNTVVPNKQIAANSREVISGGITLSAGDTIKIYGESTDVHVGVFGAEIQ